MSPRRPLLNPRKVFTAHQHEAVLSAVIMAESNGEGSAAAAAASASGSGKFDVQLWDQVELVYQRVTKGRHDLKRIKAYLDGRADVARTWVKGMKKLSDVPDTLEDSSSINQVWLEMKETSSSQIKQQESFAQACQDLSQMLESQIVELKKTKTSLHATWSKVVADVNKKQAAHDKARDAYYNSVKVAEQADDAKETAIRERQQDKVISKLEARAKQCVKQVDDLHTAYQKSVSALQEAQQTHDATVADVLQQFEKLERQRLTVFVEQLKKFADQHDELKTNIEAVAQTLHTKVNAVDIENDVQEFIRANTTGKQPSPHVEYLPRRSEIIGHALDAPASGSSSSSGASAPVAPSSSATVTSSQSGAPIPIAPSGANEQAVALYAFEQNEPDDLGFQAGQVIKLLACDEKDDWWQGELDGKVGIFPKAYVKKMDANAAVAEPAAADASAVPAAPPVGEASAPSPAASPDGADAGAGVGAGGEPGAGGVEAPKLMDARCTALFDFDGQDDDELSFKAGQHLIITGELNGWYLGRQEGQEKVGIFPANFVQIQS